MEGQNAHMYIQEHLADNSFRRRALAFDLIRLVCYEVMNSYHADLMGHMQEDHHLEIPGNSNVSVTQVLRADRAVFLHLAENLTSLKRTLDGELPLEKELPIALMRPTVSFHLLPLAAAASSKPSPKANPNNANKRKAEDPPKPPLPKQSKTKGKGKGKSKRKGRGPNVPKDLVGKALETADGRRICWPYNMASGCADAPPGGQCQRGAHVCAEVGCGKPHSLLAHKGS